jgi:hypothetical protein
LYSVSFEYAVFFGREIEFFCWFEFCYGGWVCGLCGWIILLHDSGTLLLSIPRLDEFVDFFSPQSPFVAYMNSVTRVQPLTDELVA